MLGGLFGKAGKWLGVKFIQAKMREIAEGKWGPQWQATYEWTIGKKTVWGFILLVLTLSAGYLGDQKLVTWFGTAGTTLVLLGLTDKSWRGETPDWFLNSKFYQFLGAHGADIGTLLFFVSMKLDACNEPFEWLATNCALWSRALIVVSGLLVYFNIIPPTWKTRPPGLDPCLWDEEKGKKIEP